MAQQSARRGWENQGFPQCFEHALGDLDPARELPYRPAANHRCITGRTDGSIRLRATTIPKIPLAKRGASTDGVVFRARDLLVHQRTQCINALRGHLAEYGYVFPQSITHAASLIAHVEDPNCTLPDNARTILKILIDTFTAL